MAYRVVGPRSRLTKVEIELDVDIDGNPVFDDDDKPIKGRTPTLLLLPRFNYMPFAELKESVKRTNEIEQRDTGEDYDSLDKARDLVLAQLRPFVDDAPYALLESLTWGELQDISNRWAAESNTPLGESSASNGSSKSTRRPSNTTSSATVSAPAT